jgi:transcriptional regulator with XRE-family HTH domain
MDYEKFNNIGKRLKKLRQFHGLKQDRIAREIGLSQTAYSKIETGDTSLTVTRAAAIAKVFGMTLGELLDGDEHF